MTIVTVVAAVENAPSQVVEESIVAVEENTTENATDAEKRQREMAEI